jgi:hypothetical protein
VTRDALPSQIANKAAAIDDLTIYSNYSLTAMLRSLSWICALQEPSEDTDRDP